jgi:hypothetical protein
MRQTGYQAGRRAAGEKPPIWRTILSSLGGGGMARRLDAVVAAAILSALAPGDAAAQAPVGAEFTVHSYPTGLQYGARVAADAAGNFVVVWRSNQQDGSGMGIFAQRYDRDGQPLEATEFQVNSYTSGNQYRAAVASDPSGWVMVVWESQGQDGSGRGIYGQRFDSGGGRLGPEFRVNSYTTGLQQLPSVAADGAGGFVVAWSDYRPGPRFDVYARRYDPAGFPLGPESRVNTHLTGRKERAAVAMSPDGYAVVVWDSEFQDAGQWAVVGRRLDPVGAPVGAEFRVNTYTTGTQYAAAVAADHGGNFVVVWTSDEQDGSYYGLFGQRYDAAGTPQGGEFQVNEYTPFFQVQHDVAMNPRGDFVVVWQSLFGDGNANGISGRRFDASGRVSREFVVNAYTTGNQNGPSVAMDAGQDFVVVWATTKIGSNDDVSGQRFTADLIFEDDFENDGLALAAER